MEAISGVFGLVVAMREIGALAHQVMPAWVWLYVILGGAFILYSGARAAKVPAMVKGAIWLALGLTGVGGSAEALAFAGALWAYAALLTWTVALIVLAVYVVLLARETKSDLKSDLRGRTPLKMFSR